MSSKQELVVARAALDSLLRAPVEGAVYGGAYPTMGGLLPGQVLAPTVVTAVDTLANDLNRCSNPSSTPHRTFNFLCIFAILQNLIHSFPAPKAS